MGKRLVLATTVAAFVLGAPRLTPGHHSVFDFSVDLFESEGKHFGLADGFADIVDEFDNGALSPEGYANSGPARETGGML